ncbi:hypothetical protein ACFSN5_03810 [Streptococcus tangpeifui]|uniref:hypothetical protein n=1 Tax=Streptococcus tangpeifui TaxID=2709400 RepID=UPI001F14F0C0|nr:hypothetical protein [Streptococcus sp. ZJ373]
MHPESNPNTTPAGDDTTAKSPTENNNSAATVQKQESANNTNPPTPSVTTAAGENEQEITSITPKEYEANVANLNKVSMTDVYQMFTQDGKEHTLYLGRPTCPYCRRFSPEVKKFNDLIGGQLDYFNTDSPEYDDAAQTAILYNLDSMFLLLQLKVKPISFRKQGKLRAIFPSMATSRCY